MKVTCPHCMRTVRLNSEEEMYDHTITSTSNWLCPGSGEHL